MTDDLVKRLRELAKDQDMLAPDNTNDSAELREAADRIETLEAVLREIKDWNDNQDRRSLKIAAVIDAALIGEKKE